MSTIQERTKLRRKNITFQKIDLHSPNYNSFHTHLDTKNSWELLAKLSQESWIEETGVIPINRVDKSIYKFIKLK